MRVSLFRCINSTLARLFSSVFSFVANLACSPSTWRASWLVEKETTELTMRSSTLISVTRSDYGNDDDDCDDDEEYNGPIIDSL